MFIFTYYNYINFIFFYLKFCNHFLLIYCTIYSYWRQGEGGQPGVIWYGELANANTYNRISFKDSSGFVVRPELSREKKVFFGVQPDMWADTRAPPTHSRVGRVGLLELVKNKKEIDRVISFFLNEYFVNIDSISMLLIHQVSVIPYNPLLHISLTKLVAD